MSKRRRERPTDRRNGRFRRQKGIVAVFHIFALHQPTYRAKYLLSFVQPSASASW